jgi:hypothetical protein
MSKLIYITNTSLDGYIEDQTGAFDWVNSDQVFDFITELLRADRNPSPWGRLYETMALERCPTTRPMPRSSSAAADVEALP